MEIEVKLGGVEIEVEIKGLRGLATLLGAAAVAAAVAQELRTPRERRTWHGRLARVVPYDLRPPTLARLRGSMWDPCKPDVLAPMAFGVGWTVNLAALGARLGLRETYDPEPGDALPEAAG
jgi:hypothetical protein